MEVEYRRCIVESQRARDAVEALAQQIREELADEGKADPLATIIGGRRGEGEGEEARGRRVGRLTGGGGEDAPADRRVCATG